MVARLNRSYVKEGRVCDLNALFLFRLGVNKRIGELQQHKIPPNAFH